MAKFKNVVKVSLTDEERYALRQAQNIFYELNKTDYFGNAFEVITNGDGLNDFEEVGDFIEKILEN